MSLWQCNLNTSSLAVTVHACDCCRESAETMVLLEAILDGLSDEKSGAKRDLCASAAKEFLIWSAKHIALPKSMDAAGGSANASNNLNAASLLRRLFERLMHPEAYHRSEPSCSGWDSVNTKDDAAVNCSFMLLLY